MARKIYVGGKWVETERKMEVLNPYDGSVIDEVFFADEKTFESAVQHAEKIFAKTRALPVHEKTKALFFISSEFARRKEDIARTITLESGKPIKEARAEVDRTVSVFRLAAEVIDTMHGEVIPLDITPASGNRLGIVKRFPIGPILGIPPFNFPLNLVSHKVAPAIASGNPIVIKPASATPLTALKMAEIVDETGLPKGMLQVLPADRKTADRFIEDERFAMLSFTGSPEVGWKLKNRAGKKKVVLELGGDAGVYVHKDADIDYAVERCAFGAFANAGQICISVQRILLHKDIYDDFMEKFIKKVGGLKVANPLEDDTDVGPLIDEKNAKRVLEWIEEAKRAGAEVAIGGASPSSGIVMPTVIISPPKTCSIVKNEAFGPIVNVYKAESAEDALKKLNETRFGLQAGIFTNSNQLAFDAFEKLDVGGVVINDVPTFRVDNMPYGGIKDSGFGREGLKYAIEEMTEPKILVVNRNARRVEE